MSILFTPSGHLDVATDASKLSHSAKDGVIMSGDFVRLKNLRPDRKGLAQLRHGSSKISATAIDPTIYWIEEQAGVRYAFGGTRIYRDEVAIASSLPRGQWSAIKYNAFNTTVQSIFALNGIERKRIEGSTVYEWGVAAPSAAPTIAIGTSTGLTSGNYYAKITYIRKEGSTVVFESSASAASAVQLLTDLTDHSLLVSWAIPTDTQITHVRVYRTTAGGSIYYLDQDVEVSLGIVETTTADVDLISTEPPSNNDRPPTGQAVYGPNFDGYCFILDDNRIYFCKAKQPEYWPSTYYVEAGPRQWPLKAGCIHNGQFYAANQVEIFLLQGTAATSFLPIPMGAETGTRSLFGMAPHGGHGIYHIGGDGIYLFQGATDSNVTNDRFRPIWEGQTVEGLPAVNRGYLSACMLAIHHGLLFFAYPGGLSTTADTVIVTDLASGQSRHYDYGLNLTAFAIDETNDRLMAGDSNGYIRRLEDDTVTTDDGTAVSWDMKSMDFTLPTRAHFPRWVKYDVDASQGTGITGKVILDGTVHQSHTLTKNRNIKRRLVDTGNGARMALQITGTGPVSIHNMEAE